MTAAVAEVEDKGTSLIPADEQALAAAGVADIDSEDLVLPVIQITQQLSRPVTDGKVASGHFFNSVTGRDYGDEIEFVIVRYGKGRFYVHNRDEDDERTYVANGPVAPDTWPEQYAGQNFADIPEAEEQWKERSNAGEIEWGKGPPIVTTHNFVGFALDEPGQPARIGLSRTSAPAAKKILTAMRFSRRSPWASSFKLSLKERTVRDKPFYVVQAEQGDQTESEIGDSAKELAAAIQEAGAFALNGEEVEDADKTKAAKPETPAGGVAV
jgi:hypothetical protein